MGFWAAECLLDEKKESGKTYYLVKWLGKDENGNPWEPTWVSICHSLRNQNLSSSFFPLWVLIHSFEE